MEEKKKDKDREELERLRKNKKLVGAIGVILLFAGVAVVFFAAIPLGMYDGLMTEDHLTDDSLPIRDMENATYTFDQQWIDDKMDTSREWLLIGCIPIFMGYTFMVCTGAFTSDKKNHIMHCDGSGEKKYCPECGLKLSRLEKE